MCHTISQVWWYNKVMLSATTDSKKDRGSDLSVLMIKRTTVSLRITIYLHAHISHREVELHKAELGPPVLSDQLGDKCCSPQGKKRKSPTCGMETNRPGLGEVMCVHGFSISNTPVSWSVMKAAIGRSRSLTSDRGGVGGMCW
jgi:hypothetical protein